MNRVTPVLATALGALVLTALPAHAAGPGASGTHLAILRPGRTGALLRPQLRSGFRTPGA